MPESEGLFQTMEQQQKDYLAQNWQGSFTEFIEQKLETDPRRYSRTAFQYINDMVHHYGTETFEDSGETLLRYKLFSDPFHDGHNALYGMDRTINRLVRYIKSAAQEEGKERIFILHGPVGTAKTSLLDLLARGLEHYSTLPEGECFTFSWILHKQLHDKASSLGFTPMARHHDEEVFARVPSQLRDNPLYLIPRQYRKAYLQRMFQARYGGEAFAIPHKILEGELDYNNAQIYRYLLQEYDGDWKRVVARVKVERFHFSEAQGRGIAKIFPEGNVETSSATITFDENFRYLAQLLQSINLVKFNGKYALANRGIVHYSDIFKKPVPYLQHLLSAIEEHKMDFGDVTVDIDVLIIGTTNLQEYDELRKNPVSKGLRSRMRKIDVPYLLRYSDEQRIYEQSLQEARRRRHVMPHTTEAAAMWAVLSRLEKSGLHNSKQLDEGAKQALRKLTPFVKMKLYNNEFDAVLNQQDRNHLTRDIRRQLRNEFLYEGMEGCPTRILQNVFADICETNEQRCVSPFDVFHGIRRVIEQGGVNYDFLLRKPDEGFHDFMGFLDEVQDHHLKTVTQEIENAILDVGADELVAQIRTYLQHVRAFNNKEKVRSKPGAADEEPDEKLMRGIEERVGIAHEEREEYRFKVLARATEAARKGAALNYAETYRDIYDASQRALYEEKRVRINWPMLHSVLQKMHEGQEVSAISREHQKTVDILLRNLESQVGYCRKCGIEIALFFIAKKGLASR